MLDLSIIILSYNQKGFLEQCLRNIQQAKISLDFEIIVIDNCSTDNSQKFISHLKNDLIKSGQKIKIIFNKKNLGFTRANNQGIKISQGKYILILNPDVTVLPGSVEKLYQFMEENPLCALCGPRLINPDKTIQYSCRRFPTLMTPLYRRTILGKSSWGKINLQRYEMADFDHQVNKEVDWLLGACLMVRPEAIKKVGLMDEKFFLYFQDIDWARRFWQAGWKVIYLAETEMFHYHQKLSAQKGIFLFNHLALIHTLDGLKYFWKWRGVKLDKRQ